MSDIPTRNELLNNQLSATARRNLPAVCQSIPDLVSDVSGLEPLVDEPRKVGNCVSGRLWKLTQTARSSSIGRTGAKLCAGVKDKPWAEKQAEKLARKLMKEREAELISEKKDRKVKARERKTEKKARIQRNENKSASYQVITNGQTLKTLSKKQLRNVKRTRVSKEGEIELVPAYAPTIDRKPAGAKRARR
ncbi:hypothetical protein M885DRAFT_476606 [Pelagophyceae sp. CCMP2097]|nr:hypothetical protein M885DRAFT_476606 [Pelagophyceae sp. CCMP2097]|eukprot:CAMPEP_0206820504 /NCGR_PEP_ID=MMETSP0975-20121206/11851_1 /ASSEMBLY_ACC=CAM_ASM_000399 /TAXON_ID=483370 /ORGANISM="non described non described, Strain CCMP2097" /LENGTH=191 /DNA_ID=CAMNT_0054362747 /DNA_START=55 /DNA_END=630 /DNA_ORIENTATION=+